MEVTGEPIETPLGQESPGFDLLRRGEAAVKAHDFQKAQELFREAWKHEAELDPAARQRLQDNLQLLRVTDVPPAKPQPTLTPAEAEQVRRFSTEVSQQQTAIGRLLETEPKQAWQQLNDLRKKVADAEIPDEARRNCWPVSIAAFRKRKRTSIETEGVSNWTNTTAALWPKSTGGVNTASKSTTNWRRWWMSSIS